MYRFILSALLAVLSVLSVVAYGQVYKWVDQDGNTQYSDQPPQSDAAKDESKLNITAPSFFSSGSNANSTKNIDEEMRAFKKRRTAKQEAENEQQTQAEENKRKCIDAQSKLTVFRDTPRLRLPDGKGGLTYVDEDVREKNILEAQQNIASYCK